MSTAPKVVVEKGSVVQLSLKARYDEHRRQLSEEAPEDPEPPPLAWEVPPSLPEGPVPAESESNGVEGEGGETPPELLGEPLPGHPDVPIVPGGHIVGGRFIKFYKGTSRPPYLWPEVWSKMSEKSSTG